MIFAFFDFEATDKDPKTARITEQAVGLFNEKGKMIYGYSSTLWDKSYPPINPVASILTGITDEYLKDHGDCPDLELAILCNTLRRADFLVGHNVHNYDLILLAAELDRIGADKIPEIPVIDTRMDLDIPAHIETRKLTYLATEHGIPAFNSHAAMADVFTTAALFFKYDLAKTIERSKSPSLWIRADVTFDTRELAKERKFMWDGNQKIWVKQIKEMDYENETQKAAFPLIKLNGYKPKT